MRSALKLPVILILFSFVFSALPASAAAQEIIQLAGSKPVTAPDSGRYMDQRCSVYGAAKRAIDCATNCELGTIGANPRRQALLRCLCDCRKQYLEEWVECVDEDPWFLQAVGYTYLICQSAED